MTQEETNLIYEYLHNNYEYMEGDFIRNKVLHGSKIGRKMGTLKIYPNGTACLVGAFSINKKNYNKRLAHLVYVYHHKIFPKYIKYIDGNMHNTKIENLMLTRLRQGIPLPQKFTQGKILKYKAKIELEGYVIDLGTYYVEENAIKALDLIKKYESDFSLKPQEIEELLRKELGLLPKKTKKERIWPTGVDFNKNMFRARIRVYGKRIHIGSFSCVNEAANAYMKAAKEYGRYKE